MLPNYAIIIALDKYPGLRDLVASETDAVKFEKWVRCSTGGNVSPENIGFIKSSDFAPPVKASNYFASRPAYQDVKNAFEVLRQRADAMGQKGLGTKIGQRLYIFMSGHGITPSQFGINSKEVGLLMSNVNAITAKEIGSYIPGKNIADWFCENDYFDEVLLFMDCCRDIFPVIQPYPVFAAEGVSNKARRCYAFATKWGISAKERIIDGEMQGVFTKTLLLALSGACADYDPANPGIGIMTADSLKSFMIDNTKEFLDPTILNELETREPDFDLVPGDDNSRKIVIGKVPLQRFPVTIHFANPVIGAIEVITYITRAHTVQTIPLNTASNILHLDLPRGSFFLQMIVNGKTVNTESFNVRGIEQTGREANHTLNFQ